MMVDDSSEGSRSPVLRRVSISPNDSSSSETDIIYNGLSARTLQGRPSWLRMSWLVWILFLAIGGLSSLMLLITTEDNIVPLGDIPEASFQRKASASVSSLPQNQLHHPHNQWPKINDETIINQIINVTSISAQKTNVTKQRVGYMDPAANAKLLQHSNWPKLIHATTRDPDNLEKREHEPIESCKKLNPDYKYKLYNDRDIRRYVKKHFRKLLPLYDSLENQVMRTDMWRYLVLYEDGGVYLDTDITCVRPVDEWVLRFPPELRSQINAVVGVEIIDKGYLQFTQWTMYSKPGHVIFAKTIQNIQKVVRDRQLGIDKDWKDAVQITGPVPFSDAIMQYMQAFNVTKQQVMSGGVHVAGDLGILNVNGFAPLQGHSNATLIRNHPEIMVIHGFFGRWHN